MKLSVIICTHNPRADYLIRVLDALKAQTLPKEQWELLLIDNASKEPLAHTWDLSWHSQSRHIREERVGKTHALLTAFREARGELLMTVDDDNVLKPDYLAQTLTIHREHPYLGVFGAGVLEPEFEVTPPKEIVPRLGLLALREVSSPLWSNNPHDPSCIPWGAGFSATRQTVERYLQLIQKMDVSEILGPNGNCLTRGDDDLFSWASVQTGHGFGVFPELQITHLISSGRLTQSYLVRLVEDHQFSHGVLKYLLAGIEPRRQKFTRNLLILLEGVRHGSFAMRCQLAAARGARRATNFICEQQLTPLPVEPESLPAADANG